MSEGSEPTGPVEVTVLVEDDRVATIDVVVASLARAGLHVTETLESVGAVSGSVDDPGSIDVLRRVDGVASVEISRAFQLPHPDEPVQ
jgi:hypothetical protein